jgi:hypothetical protein
VGVDLEVEKKFKEKIKLLPPSSQRPAALSPIRDEEELGSLRQEVEELQRRCSQSERERLSLRDEH